MKLIEQRLLRGPNLYSRKPCLMAILDLEDLDERPSTDFPGFTDRLVKSIPSLGEHRCSPGYPGGFIERLREGTYMAHIVEHVLIELQCLAGTEIGFGKARMVSGRPRHYRVVCEFELEQLACQALPVAMNLVRALTQGTSFDLEPEIEQLRSVVSRHRMGLSTQAIVDAARRRGIPWTRITDTSSLIQLGWGVHQRRIQATMSDRTSYIAAELASDKALTKQLLSSVGLPVPTGEVASSAEEAVGIAAEIGGPVVVKPLDGNQGKGVTMDVCKADDVTAAFHRAYQHSRYVIVEQMVHGADYRVLVVGDRVIAASRRSPPQIVGDGVAPIHVLVEMENRSPLRGDGHGNALTRIAMDEAAQHALAAQHLTLQDVPALGQRVYLRANANLSTGGTAEDVTAQLNAKTAQACVLAARRIGLDIAGIDLVCRDIARPLAQQGGAIIEVNAAPGIRMHEHPSSGAPRHAGEAIVDTLFPARENGRIPLIAVTGTNGKTTTTVLIAHVLKQAGHVTGVCTTEGIFIDGEAIEIGDCTGYWSARKVLSNPQIEAAVLETARGGILKRGLGFDACDIGVVLNVEDDHLGQDGVERLEDLAAVKALVADAASRAVVLNAQDPHCLAMRADVHQGVETIFFTMDRANQAFSAHLAQGGRGVYQHDGQCYLARGSEETMLIHTHDLPITLHGAARHNIQNTLAAIAALWGMDVSLRDIVAGLTSFVSDVQRNPLRLNIFAQDGVTILLDYAHNAAGYRAIIETARGLTAQRVIGVAAAPGDRTSAKIKDMGAVCAAGFDEVVTCDMEDLRGRAPGEAAKILRAGALEAGMSTRNLHTVPDYRSAIQAGFRRCRPGDVLVVACASYLVEFQQALQSAVQCAPRVQRPHKPLREQRFDAIPLR
jgi:cyanophycin synthetase